MDKNTRQNPTRSDRPQFHPEYGIDRANIAGMLPWDWVEERMTTSRNYWICTSSPEGLPHAAPVWGVWLDGTFLFGTNPLSRKGRNLSVDPRVVVHLESGDEVVVFEGVLEELTDPLIFERMAAAYESKYGGFRPVYGQKNTAYFRLLPQTAYAWRESDFLNSAARWHFD